MATPRSPESIDTNRRRVEEAYFDGAGEPTQSKKGYAKAITQYDESGNEMEEAYFDQEGKPTRYKGWVRENSYGL